MARGCLSEEEVSGYWRGELPVAAADDVQAHADGCDGCRELLSAAADSKPTAESVSTTFTPGERVGGRYQVVRFIARGGMGEVYEVDDEELKERVALKTVSATISDDGALIARLKREVLLSRRVTHPNVCRVFDVGRHAVAGGAVVFLTMELLAGETLGRRLRRDGALPPAEARALAGQLAAGLAAAHAAGVVHRDFKSDNVQLVGTRAVVTDFGLARTATQRGDRGARAEPARRPDPPAGNDTLPADALSVAPSGTPRYMAPEQAAGGSATPAADVYALGVVLHEMITGHLPGDGAPATDPRWRRVIDRCLAEDPAQRFAGPLEVVRALDPPRRRRRFAVAIAAVVVAAVAVAVAGWRLAGHRSHAGKRVVTSVRLVPPRNLSGRADDAWMAQALREIVAASLSGGGGPAVTAADDPAPVDAVVRGMYLAVADRLQVAFEIEDGDGRRVLAEVDEAGPLADAGARAGIRLRRALGAADLPDEVKEDVRRALPADPRAMRLFATGLAQQRARQLVVAAALFQQALAIEPDHPLMRAALAETLGALGYAGKAVAEAERAWRGSHELSRERQLQIEGNFRALGREWDRAVEVRRALVTFYPERVEYAARLARTQYDARRSQDALATIAAARARLVDGAEALELDEVEALLRLRLDQPHDAWELASRIRRRGEAVGSAGLVAEGTLLQARAMSQREQFQVAQALFEAARRAYLAAGDPAGAARTLTFAARVYADGGDLAAARSTLDQAFAIDLARGDTQGLAMVLGYIGIVARRQGELDAAETALNEALSLKRGLGQSLGADLNSLANLAQERGDRQGAARRLAEAAAADHADGMFAEEALARRNLGAALYFLGEDAPAERELASAAKLATEYELHEISAGVIMARALIYFDRDDGRAVEADLRQAVAVFQRERQIDWEVLCTTLLATALALEGARDEARALIARVSELLPRVHRREAIEEVGFRLAYARGLLGGDDAVAAIAALDARVAEQGRERDGTYDARLARDLLLVRGAAGPRGRGCRDLAALAAEADAVREPRVARLARARATSCRGGVTALAPPAPRP